MAANDPARRLFRFDRQINPIAVLALALALSSTIYQACGYIAGPTVALLPPDQVEVRAAGHWTIVVAPMVYANTGRQGYDGLVVSETVTLQVNASDNAPAPGAIELHWQSFGLTDYRENERRITGNALPFIVQGAGAISHETEFHPRNVPCVQCAQEVQFRNYLSWDELLAAISAADGLNLQFEAQLHGGQRLTTECYMPLDEGMREYMTEYSVFTRSCYRSETDAQSYQ